MKTLKRLLIGFLVLLLLGVGVLLAAPLLFKDQIVANVKQSLNRSLDAEVDFGEADLSFLSSFPDIHLTVEDLSVMGIDTFANLPLLTTDRLGVDLGFWSVLAGEGEYQIEAVELERPVVNLLVLGPELVNYLIVPDPDPAASEPDPAPAAAQFNLQHFEVTDGTLVYDDRTTETYVEVHGLNGTGDGDFSSRLFDLHTLATAEALTVSQGGITYLNEVKTDADASVRVDLAEQRYTFLDNRVTLNALDLEFAGSIDLEDNDDILFDLDYRAPADDFRQFWSMIPSAYTAGYEQVRTRGTFTLVGTIDGAYNAAANRYPAFTVRAEVADGSVQYPGRSVGLTGINATINLDSPTPDPGALTVDIPRFDFALDGEPFRGRLRLADLNRDPRVDGRIDGRVDLGKWAQAVPMEGVRELSGVLTADLSFDGVRQSLVASGRYDDLRLGGTISLDDFSYVDSSSPAVGIDRLRADVSPRNVSIGDFVARFGQSDLTGSANINDPLAYLNPEQTLTGEITLRSDFLNLDEWMPTDTDDAPLSPAEMNAPTAPGPGRPFDRFAFTVDANVGALQYAGYRPEKLNAQGTFTPNRAEVTALSAELGKSDFSGSGTLLGLYDFSFGEGVLGGSMDLRSRSIRLADFQQPVTPTASSSESDGEATAAVSIPPNINVRINLGAEEVLYDNLTLRNLAGDLLIADAEALLENGSAALLGGRMDFSGGYDTRPADGPAFRFRYDLQSLDFQQAFTRLNTFAALAPLGKFLEGRFSTDLLIEGNLGEDLLPLLSSIDARGFFATAEARINGFEPAVRIGEALNIEELKSSSTLRNLVTVFQVERGRVAIEPFRMRLAGVPLTVQGTHGLNMDMDYRIEAAIPREMIGGNIVTGTALTALDKLAGEAARLGLNIKPADTRDVAIQLGGSISNPTTRFSLLGSRSGAAGDQGGILDDARQQINDRVQAERERAEAEVAARVEAARAAAEARIDSLRRLAGERAEQVQDSIRRAVAAETERLRQEAENRLRLRLDSMRLDSLLPGLPPISPPVNIPINTNRIRQELERFRPSQRRPSGGG